MANPQAAYQEVKKGVDVTVFRRWRRNPTSISDINFEFQPNIFTFSWFDRDCATPIAYQGKCDSCWAVVTVRVIVDAFNSDGYVRGVPMVDFPLLSAQMLLDCCMFPNYTSYTGMDTKEMQLVRDANGCYAWSVEKALSWIVKNNGLGFESDYPYVAKKQQCRAEVSCTRVVSGFQKFSDYDSFLMHLHDKGTVAARVDIFTELHHPGNATYFGPKTNTKYFGGHAIRVTGMGIDPKGIQYVECANSWGLRWGTEGKHKVCKDMEIKIVNRATGKVIKDWHPLVYGFCVPKIIEQS